MSEALTFQLVEGHLKKVKIFEGQMKRQHLELNLKVTILIMVQI